MTARAPFMLRLRYLMQAMMIAFFAVHAATAAETDNGLMPPSETEEPISDAERLLWLTDQVTNVAAGTLLRYRYEGHAADEDSVEDEVDLEILAVNDDGSRQASIYFFTGDRNRYVAPLERATGNPVLGVYLQEDVYGMEDVTEGSWRYFHRRVKKALAHDATIEDIEIDFDGRKLPAKRVVIEPYAFDEQRDQFEDFAEKRYEVVLSEAVPGTLYEIHTVVPSREPGAPPLREELLRLDAVKRTGQQDAGSTAQAPAQP